MRRVLAALAALLLVLVAGCDGASAPATSPSKVDVDTPALREQKAAAGIETCVPGSGSSDDGSDLPDLTLPCLGGGPDVELSTLRGPALVNLWYSACGPCRQEMPLLQQLHDQYADRLAVIGLDIEQYPDAALDFLDAIGATYPQLADPGGTVFDSGDLGLRAAYPQTLFVDADGKIAHVAVGEIKSLDEAHELVRTHLGVAPVSAP
jgi:thiol-disulfide isomerase/thioredoxin